MIYDPEKWDRKFLGLMDHVAQWSKDPSSKVGCVITDDLKRVISLGYNGFPRGVGDDPRAYADREKKYKLICHAERNALDNAPCSVRGMTMYTTVPCNECQKSIIQSGIARVVFYKPDPELVKRWNIDLDMLKMTGILLKEYTKTT